MSNRHNGSAGLHSFERNHYFYGKLLTVRDMATEQAYHSDVQRTLSRHVTDFGGVCGLDVTSETTTDEDGDEVLEVTVSEGLALDKCGRLVVVADEVTKTLAVPVYAEEGGEEVETDTVSVYVEYDECLTEPVPVAKTESACDDECEDNRVIEDAEVTVVPGEPSVDPKPVAEVEFPDPLELGETDDRFAERVAVRGDVKAESPYAEEPEEPEEPEKPTTVPLDLVFAEGVPPGTARMTLSVSATDQVVRGRLSLPEGQFLDDGLRVPDGEFDVTGSVSFIGENYQQSKEFAGTLEVRDENDRVTVSGVLDDPQTDGEFDFDVAFNRTDGGYSLETLDGGSGDYRSELALEFDIEPLDGDRLVTGTMKLLVVRGTGENRTEYPIVTVETTEWEREDGETFEGLFVDVPEREGAGPTETEIDHLLAGMARSYYENEPRESCPEVSTGPVLVGTVTRDGDTWAETTFERGPLVYTNDMLYDVMARHVSDFENPHDVKLEVGGGAAADGGTGGRDADAAIGVEGPAGPEGTVGLTSSDGSIEVRPDRGFQTLDLTADVGTDAEFEQYHVFERSLQTTGEAFTELVEDSNRVWAPRAATQLAFRIARTAMHALEKGVHESPAEYVDYLTGPHRPYYPEEQLPMGTSTSMLSHSVQEAISVVELERMLLEALEPNDEIDHLVPVGNYRRALETLEGYLADDRAPTEKATDVARAQYRLAAAAETVLDSHPAVASGYEGEVAGGRRAATHVGRGVVPEEFEGAARLERVIRVLHDDLGWTYQIRSESVSAEDVLDHPINEVREIRPGPDDAGHKAAGVRLTVVDPPPTRRIYNLGDVTQRKLAHFGLDRIAEFAVGGAEVVKLVTNASADTVSTWAWKADRYCDAYVLTRAQDIGLLEAEAFAEVGMALSEYFFDDVSDLTAEALDEEQLLTDLEETSDEEIPSKYKDALQALDWEAVRGSI